MSKYFTIILIIFLLLLGTTYAYALSGIIIPYRSVATSNDALTLFNNPSSAVVLINGLMGQMFGDPEPGILE